MLRLNVFIQVSADNRAAVMEAAKELVACSLKDNGCIAYDICVHYLAVVEYAENEDDVNDDAQLVILSVGEDDEGEYLDVVEDDETLLEVSKLFEKRLSDQFEIE